METIWQIAINIQDYNNDEVEFLLLNNYNGSVMNVLQGLEPTFYKLPKIEDPSECYYDCYPNLDYLRQDLFPNETFSKINTSLLNETFSNSINCKIYAIGQRWIDGDSNLLEKNKGKSIGVHDIHMNQGNKGKYKKYNGIYQDGGLFIENYSENYNENKVIAMFFRFSSQCLKTNNEGNCF